MLCYVDVKYIGTGTEYLFVQHNGANIQLLDLPGIIEGAAQGKLCICYCQVMTSFHVDLL